MAANVDSDQRTLADLRARIDALDEAMHELLIERGTVIDALIAAKGTARSGAAFRPQREADMMRRLVARHRGRLPLAAVEHLWREIISTFTWLQAPFRVVVDYGADALAIHDIARFTFGYTVDLVPASSPGEVVDAIVAAGSGLGLVPLKGREASGPWWRRLSAISGPQVMALLPFITLPNRPAGTPALILSPILAEPAASDLAIFAATAGDDIPADRVAILAEARDGGRRELLLAARGMDAAGFRAAGFTDVAVVGGIARGIALNAEGSLLREPLRLGGDP